MGVLASLVVPANTNAIESGKIDTPVIAVMGFGFVSAVWSQPVGQAISDEYSLEVCHDADCFVALFIYRDSYTRDISASRTSIRATFQLLEDRNGPVSFFPRNRGLPLTATISAGSSPSDSTRSDPSAFFYVDPPDASPIDTTQQFMQPVLKNLLQNGFAVGLCFNRTSDAFRWQDSGFYNVGLKFPGYSLMYELSKDGTVIQSGKSKIGNGSGIQGNWFNGVYCEDGAEGDERFGTASNGYPSGIDAGTTYTFTYKLVDGASQTVSGSLDFTTPGGCPSTTTGPPQHLVTPGWAALLDSSGHYLAMFQGFSPRQSAYMPKTQWANLYWSSYKTMPNNSSFVYIPEIDDFAMDLSSVITSGKYMIKDATIFKDCSPEQVQVVASVKDLSGKSNDSACQIVEGNIIPLRVGRCILRVQITRRASVTASGARKMGFAFTRDLAVNFSSMPTSTNTAPSTTSISKAPVVRISRTTSGKSIASFLKLAVTSKSTIRLRIATSSLKFCKVKGTSIRGLKAGRCKLTISVKPKRGATKSRTVSLTVTK